MSDYYKMPPLYVEDEYHKCMDETESESVFCSTITTIKPDNGSEIWRLIAVSLALILFYSFFF